MRALAILSKEMLIASANRTYDINWIPKISRCVHVPVYPAFGRLHMLRQGILVFVTYKCKMVLPYASLSHIWSVTHAPSGPSLSSLHISVK